MKIKILEVYEHHYGNDNDYVEYDKMKETDWEEVSEEDFNCLLEWAKHKNNIWGNKSKIVIIAQKQIDIPKTIKDYLRYIKDEGKREEEKKKKLEEKYNKIKMTKLKKKEEKEKKLFEQLREKYKE